MRNQARFLTWILSAFAFAGAVVLAITTAAIEAGNVEKRRALERVWEEVEALEAGFEAEKVEWRRAAEPPRLAEHVERLMRRNGE